MFHQPLLNTPHIYRALVTYSDEHTGEIRVKIPSFTGIESEVPISYIGRKKKDEIWVVPDVNEQIVVASDDANLTNVFWLLVGGGDCNCQQA